MPEEIERRAHAIFMQALDVDPAVRDRFVSEQCQGDAGLMQRVRRLLGAAGRSGGFLETPALGTRSGSSALRAAPPAPSAIMARGYRIIRVIGVGGMATVYEAEQEQPCRTVALKVMNRALADTSAVRRFRYETEVLARLQHPGVAAIFEAGTCDDGSGHPLPFFAMEFIAEARTITGYADACSLPLRARLAMLAEVCDAVQHGHGHGVVHRDLKPANILVDGAGRSRVIDFGVAKSTRTDEAGITRRVEAGQLIGTLNFMSPEQCAGAADLDARTDVYSLGVVLYHLVSGRLPHDLGRVAIPEAVRIIAQDPPPRLGSLCPAAKGDLEAIATKAMEKDRSRRYASAGAFASDIRRYLNHQTIDARMPTLAHQARLFAQRHRVLVGAGVALLATLITASTAVSLFAYRATRESHRRLEAEHAALRERDAARRQSYSANIAAAFAALRADEYQQLRTRLAAAAPEHRGWEWRFLTGMAERSDRTTLAHNDMIFAFASSPDGKRLATGSGDGTMAVWDAESGACQRRIDGFPDAGVAALAFDPGGTWILSGSQDGAVRIWDTASGEIVREVFNAGSRVLHVAWGQGGRIAISAENGEARLWVAGWDGPAIDLSGDHRGGVHGVCISRDGSRLLTWNQRGDVWLRTSDNASVLQRWRFDGVPQCGAISGDNTLAAAGGADGRVMVWSADTGTVAHDLSTPDGNSTVRCLAFSNGGDRLAAGQTHRGIALWPLREAGDPQELRGHEEAVSGVWFTPDDRRLVSASWDRTLRVWSVAGESGTGSATTLAGHDDHVITAVFSPDGSLVASAGRDKTVRLWEPELGIQVGTLCGHRAAVYALAFSPDGSTLASGAHDRTVLLWDTQTGAALPPIHSISQVWTVAFSPDGGRLAVAGEDGITRIWDTRTRELLLSLEPHAERVIRVAFSPDGRLLASASRDRTVRLWDAETGDRLHSLAEHESDVFGLAFSHDGRWLYTGSRDQTVRVWDTASGDRSGLLDGQGQFVTCLSLSPDGTRLAAGSWFGEIVLWDTASSEAIAFFKGHNHAIRSITFDPTGRWLLSGSYDRTVRLFDSLSPPLRRARRAEAASGFAWAQERIARGWKTTLGAGLSAASPEAEEADAARRGHWLRVALLRQGLEAASAR